MASRLPLTLLVNVDSIFIFSLDMASRLPLTLLVNVDSRVNTGVYVVISSSCPDLPAAAAVGWCNRSRRYGSTLRDRMSLHRAVDPAFYTMGWTPAETVTTSWLREDVDRWFLLLPETYL
jgi:hypothetical protein